MRNLSCASYAQCLDRAALANLPGFSCGGCPRRSEEAPPPPGLDRRCAVLVAALWLPDLYAAYCREIEELETQFLAERFAAWRARLLKGEPSEKP
ncbi:MAG: hypothetical protein ACOY8P_05045 [Thermodesulfobacteriota bacterium]